jgi:hypothetical protein
VGDLNLRVQDAAGTTLDSCNVPASALPTAGVYQWVTCSLTHAPKLVSGNTYYVVLKAPSDTVNRTYALRDGSSFGYPRLFSPTATLKWEAAQPGRLDLLGKDQSAGWRPAVLLNSPVANS